MRYLLLTSWFDMQDCRTRSNMLRCFFLHWNVVQTLGGSGLGWVIFTWSLYCSYMSGRHLGFHMPEVRHGLRLVVLISNQTSGATVAVGVLSICKTVLPRGVKVEDFQFSWQRFTNSWQLIMFHFARDHIFLFYWVLKQLFCWYLIELEVGMVSGRAIPSWRGTGSWCT